MARDSTPIMMSLCRIFDRAVDFAGLFIFILLFPVATVIDGCHRILSHGLDSEHALLYARYAGAFLFGCEVVWIISLAFGFARQPSSNADISFTLAIPIPVGGALWELILAWFTSAYALLISSLVLMRWTCDCALYCFWRAPFVTALCVGSAVRNLYHDDTT